MTTLDISFLSSRFSSKVKAENNIDKNEFKLLADSVEKEQETGDYIYQGNVNFLYPKANINGTAREAVYLTDKQEITLAGNVILNQGGKTIRGEGIHCYLNEKRCFVVSNELIIAPK